MMFRYDKIDVLTATVCFFRFQVVYNDEMELERQKRQYVFSVRSHMTENQVATQGRKLESKKRKRKTFACLFINCFRL